MAKPVASEREVLVRVAATTVNRTDCGYRAAKPFILFFTGLRRPRPTRRVLGTDLPARWGRSGAASLPSRWATVSSATSRAYSVRRRYWPLIDRRYPLDEIVEAYRYAETGEKVGNIVISPTG